MTKETPSPIDLNSASENELVREVKYFCPSGKKNHCSTALSIGRSTQNGVGN